MGHRHRLPGGIKNAVLAGLCSEQSIYHLNNRMVELEVIPACRHYGLGLIPWSPLGGGLLAGALEKLQSGRRTSEDTLKEINENRAKLEHYEALCEATGRTSRRRGPGLAFAQSHRDRANHRPPNNRAIGICPARHGNLSWRRKLWASSMRFSQVPAAKRPTPTPGNP